MPQNRRIGREAHTPQKRTAHQREALSGKVVRELPVSAEQCRPSRTDIVPAGRNGDAEAELDQAGERCGQRSAPRLHPGCPEKAEDEHGVEKNVDDHRSGTDPGTGLYVIRHLHDGKVALGNSRQQIGPAGNPQIGASDGDQFGIAGKGLHEDVRDKLTGTEEQQGQEKRIPQHEVKQALQRVSIPFPPVLGTEDGPGAGDGHEENVLHKLDLGRQRNGGHLRLKDNGQGKPPQLVIKNFVIDRNGFLRSSDTWPGDGKLLRICPSDAEYRVVSAGNAHSRDEHCIKRTPFRQEQIPGGGFRKSAAQGFPGRTANGKAEQTEISRGEERMRHRA